MESNADPNADSNAGSGSLANPATEHCIEVSPEQGTQQSVEVTPKQGTQQDVEAITEQGAQQSVEAAPEQGTRRNFKAGPDQATNQSIEAASDRGEDKTKQPPTFAVKAGLAQMLKGGVIMDVTDAAQARIAEEAGACAVMALERVPADIRRDGGVARMSDPAVIRAIQEAVTIPVMAKARIGHFVECQVLEALGVDFVDESEVLTPADAALHVDKRPFSVPFVCGCRDLGEALRRVAEGAAMIRTKGEAGTGDVVEAVRHARRVAHDISRAKAALAAGGDPALRALARELGCDVDLLRQTAEAGRLPVVNFAAGGIATPADAALMMQLGCDGVFVGSGIFKSGNAAKRAAAIVQATTHFRDPLAIARASEGLGEAMVGINCSSMIQEEKMAGRGW